MPKLIEVTTKALFWIPDHVQIVDKDHVTHGAQEFYAEPRLIPPHRHTDARWAELVEGSEETTITEVPQ